MSNAKLIPKKKNKTKIGMVLTTDNFRDLLSERNLKKKYSGFSLLENLTHFRQII